MSAQVIEVAVLGTNVKASIQVPESLRILQPDEKIPDGFGCIRIIHQKAGDIRIVWDSNNFGEIINAKDTFNELIEKGMVPYLVDPETGRATHITDKFDPFAEELVMKDDHRRSRREIIASPELMLAGG